MSTVDQENSNVLSARVMFASGTPLNIFKKVENGHSHEFLFNEMKNVVGEICIAKFLGIKDDGSNVKRAREMFCKKYNWNSEGPCEFYLLNLLVMENLKIKSIHKFKHSTQNDL